MEKIKKILIKLISPSAFKLGLVITFGIYYVASDYYYLKAAGLMKDQNELSLVRVIEDWNLQSNDVKLLARGPRYGTDQVALLAIDETSVENLGRWPWPRGIIAEMIEEIMKYDAKVVAFDVIFAEPDNNQAVLSLNKLKEQVPVNSPFDNMINEELKQANTDLELAKTIEKYADRLIMGVYYDPLFVQLDPYQEFCSAIAYDLTREGSSLMNEEVPLAVLDSVEVGLPDLVLEFLEGNFETIATDIRESGSVEEKNLNQEIFNKSLEFCATWLYDQDLTRLELMADWPQIKEEEEIELEFEDWANYLRNYSPRSLVESAGRLWMNMPILQENTKHTAYFNAHQDKDGTIRKVNLLHRYGNTYLPSMGLKTVMLATGQGLLVNVDRNPYAPSLKGISSIQFTDSEGAITTKIPADVEGHLPINYAGKSFMFPYISVYELFNGKETAIIQKRNLAGEVKEIEVDKAEWIKDKIFLVGATATGIYDLRVTPFQENFPGPETHVNVIDNLLRQDFIKNHPDETNYMLASILIVGIIFSFLIGQLGALFGLILTVASLTGTIFADFHFLFLSGFSVSIIFPVVLFISLYIALTFFKYLTEERKKKELKGTFQKYVSPAIVDEVLKDPENVQLGGKKERMTVLFSDIRGFTTISEQLDPQALSDLLNIYLTPMTDLVFSNKGTLDKYMGDAVMAFFGAPISYPEHAKMGVKCALEMLEKLEILRKEFKEKGLPDMDIGIGLNTGDMSVGNMGSETVRSYTVMGDAVNLGARLEGINKQYGTRIIISEFTYQDCKDDFICREIDWVKVKGKLEPVRIFEVVGFNDLKDQNLVSTVDNFKLGFDAYHSKNFEEAMRLFQEAESLTPKDGPSLLYIERTQNYLNSPPPENWDGVFTMTTK
ncbi:MAG: CHASE2 domain-containing protein [Bdellovibrionales bacterium]